MRPWSARLALISLLSLAGCSGAGGLFSNDLIGQGVSAVADNGGSIVKYAGKVLSGPSYCRKAADSTQVYKVEDGDCDAGDTAIKSYDYDQQVAANQQTAWNQLHSAALAEAAQPTYCRTATASLVYRPASGKCQGGEETIGEEEYNAAKAEAKAAATKVP